MADDGYSGYWSRLTATRRTALAGMGALGAGALLAACGGGSNNNKSSSSKPASNAAPAGSSASGSTAASPAPSGASQNQAPPKDPSKLTLEQMRTTYAGSLLKNLPGQKNGPIAGGTLHFESQTPVNWDPTSP